MDDYSMGDMDNDNDWGDQGDIQNGYGFGDDNDSELEQMKESDRQEDEH